MTDLRDLGRQAPEPLVAEYRELWRVLYFEERPAALKRAGVKPDSPEGDAFTEDLRATVLSYLVAEAPVALAEEAARAFLKS